MLKGWEFRSVPKRCWPLLGHKKGQNKEILLKLKNLFLMNHWPECIDIWHGTSLGQED